MNKPTWQERNGSNTALIRQRSLRDLLAFSDKGLDLIDPLEMNLVIAKSIPRLADLDILKYQRLADQWAKDIRRKLEECEGQFHESPGDWKNDIAFFRLGVLAWYVDEQLGVRYREDQRDLKSVYYTDPSDLFLNGVMDTRRGTCGNMAALHVVLGRRLGWPVSLACVGPHFICRYDDGKVTHNIEATRTGGGGFHSHPDDFYLASHGVPQKAVDCGSDLRALTTRELLGVFVGLRARHLQDVGELGSAEVDYLLARHLFPRRRWLHYAEVTLSVQSGIELFEPYEHGHPVGVASWLREVVDVAPWNFQANQNAKECTDASNRDAGWSYDYSGKQN